MECKLCGHGFQGSQTKAASHFTINNNCPKVSVEQLSEIWNKTNYKFDQSHCRKILGFLKSRGYRDNRCTSGREQAGEEDEDNEDERRAAEGREDDGDIDMPTMDVRREVERAKGKMRREKAVDEDSTPGEEEEEEDDDDQEADIGASLDEGADGWWPSRPRGGSQSDDGGKGIEEAKEEGKRDCHDDSSSTSFAEEEQSPSTDLHGRGLQSCLAMRFFQLLSAMVLRQHPALPTHGVISGDDILEQQLVVADLVAVVRKDIAATGATILMDGRKSITSDQIVNFLAAGPTGAYLFRTVRRDDVVQETAEAVVERWQDVFDKFDVKNVNTICTDSASAYVAASKLLTKEEVKYSCITWLPCAVHVCNLLLSDIAKDGSNGKIGKREDTIITARVVVPFIREHGAALSLYRREHDKTLAEKSLRYLRQQTGDDEDLYQTLCMQLADTREGDWTYTAVEGDKDVASCRGEKETSQVGQWWVQHGDGVPLVQSYAIRLTHTWKCASPAERNWAVHKRVHVKKRNKLGFIKLTRLVEISTNLRLSRCQGRRSGYVLPREDAEEETKDAIPPPCDEGVRPADRVTKAQRERQVQRGQRDRLSKAPPSVETYFGRRATVLMPTELDSVYDPEPDPMAQDPIEAELWSDPDDLAVELEAGDSDEGRDDAPLAEMMRPRTRGFTAGPAPPSPPPRTLSAPDVPLRGLEDWVGGTVPQPSTDCRGHDEQGGRGDVEERDDDNDREERGYEGNIEDDDDPAYSPTHRRGPRDILVTDAVMQAGEAAGRVLGVRGTQLVQAVLPEDGRGESLHRPLALYTGMMSVSRQVVAVSAEVAASPAEFAAASAEVAAGSAEVAAEDAEAVAASTEVVAGSAEVGGATAEVGRASAYSAQFGPSFNDDMFGASLGLPSTPTGERGTGGVDAQASPSVRSLEVAEDTEGSSGQREHVVGDDGECRPVQEQVPESEQDITNREERERALELARRCEMTRSIAAKARAERMLETGDGAGHCAIQDAEVECGRAVGGDAGERHASPVHGVCVLPFAGAMSAGELERQTRKDPLRADRRARMDEASRRVMAEGPTFVLCSPSVPSSATYVIPPTHTEGPGTVLSPASAPSPTSASSSASAPSPASAPAGESPFPKSWKKKMRIMRARKSLSTLRRVTHQIRASQPALVGLHLRTLEALGGDIVADTAGWRERASTQVTTRPMSTPAEAAVPHARGRTSTTVTEEHDEHSCSPGGAWPNVYWGWM
ncbi:hypothetical protein CBR_g19763 [Chara braunii]|uniref:DUF659 domain-containing protein n=1 Tax=Chara braunii TaxID=69332 RepID=A0A388JTV9_CHABU|nr:hypothetical protein CBR_g19763 [Chara braunii]|eukprot:GBG61231.1 hypothetical protein CBR_g19763 [Chara braunii]